MSLRDGTNIERVFRGFQALSLPTSFSQFDDLHSISRERAGSGITFSLSPRLSGERAGVRGFSQAGTIMRNILLRVLSASSPWPSPPSIPQEERELILAFLDVLASNVRYGRKMWVMTRLSSPGYPKQPLRGRTIEAFRSASHCRRAAVSNLSRSRRSALCTRFR